MYPRLHAGSQAVPSTAPKVVRIRTGFRTPLTERKPRSKTHVPCRESWLSPLAVIPSTELRFRSIRPRGGTAFGRGLSMSCEPADDPTPAELLILAKLIADRERRGTEWCFEHGIGPMRHVLGAVRPANVTDLPLNRSRSGLAFLQSQKTAQGRLAAECKRCGGCRLGREG